ncbi:MAG: helix-turn-helix transcriptional regulator [Candidatus Saccharibacteria bacterium]
MTSDAQADARKALGQTFLKARQEKRLTQAQVADLAKVHINFYARMERGEENPSFEKLRSVMQVLGIKSLELN